MRNLTKLGSKINSKIGKAISDHDLIEDGDKILVAVSGGKDSLTLLHLLKQIQSWAPVKFDLFAVHVKTDINRENHVQEKRLIDFFEDIGVDYKFTDVKVLDKEGKTNCFWCSWNKRKTLFLTADELGFNKVALGHHKDDIVETMLMNLIYNGEISAMNPLQEMFKGKITIIRPLCYVEEKTIKDFAKEMDFPHQLCKCPYGNDSKRAYIKDFIRNTEKMTPKINIKTNIFKSISRIKEDYINLSGTDKKEAL